MANLNVLPQVSAKPQTSASNVKGDLKNGKNADASKEFQSKLNDAASAEKAEELSNKGGAKAPTDQAALDQLALLSSEKLVNEKEAAEKSAQALLVAGAKAPVVVPQVKTGAEVKAEQTIVTDTSQKGMVAGAMIPQVGMAKGTVSLKGLTPQQMQLAMKDMTPQELAKLQASESKLQSSGLANAALNSEQLKNTTDSVAKTMNSASGVHAAKAMESAMTAMNGVSLSSIPDEHSFSIDSLDVKDGSSFNDGVAVGKSGVPSSKLSTSDYLSLRDLSQQAKNNQPLPAQFTEVTNKDILSGLSASGVGMKAVTLGKDRKGNGTEETSAAPVIAFNSQNGLPMKSVDAPVTTGSNQNTVLSHDALHQITSQVSLFSQAKQDGEIKIRLRPDHLGELQMSVKTQGQMVSVQIKAQNGESKKIIEDSLSALRDSLSSQGMTLGRVDVVTQPQQAANPNDAGMQLDLGQFRQNHDQQSSNQSSQQDSRQDRLFDDGVKPANLNVMRAANAARARTAASSGGLDMIA